MKVFVWGRPAPFATTLEKAWKEALKAQIPEKEDNLILRGIKLIFHLESFFHNNRPFDLDNLVEPVLSVLVNKKGYFGGKRSNIRQWYAKKVKSSAEGVDIELSEDSPLSLNRKLLIDDVYNGAIPSSAKSKDLPDWLTSKTIKHPEKGDRFSVHLSFPEGINIGDIATGIVKSTIDCLYPVIGGSAGSPEDWRIDEILVEKGRVNGIGIRIFGD